MLFWTYVCMILSMVHSETMINRSLHISQATYCDSAANWSCLTCDTDTELLDIVENSGERALVAMYDHTLWIGFRGSSNIQNWINNVQFSFVCPYTSPTICVEKGFYTIYTNMYEDIHKVIEKYTQYTQCIIFTGHSLGGAIATLFAYDMVKQNNKNIHVITFGSPRVGNEEFVQDFITMQDTNASYRITHKYDIVPHVPQEFLGYLHIPHELWYYEDDHYMDCDDSEKEDSQCSDSCGPLHCTSINDHMHYLDINMGSDGDC